MNNIKPIVLMTNWIIIPLDEHSEILCGDAINHPILGSGRIYTSLILNKNNDVIETRNTIYQLVDSEQETH